MRKKRPGHKMAFLSAAEWRGHASSGRVVSLTQRGQERESAKLRGDVFGSATSVYLPAFASGRQENRLMGSSGGFIQETPPQRDELSNGLRAEREQSSVEPTRSWSN